MTDPESPAEFSYRCPRCGANFGTQGKAMRHFVAATCEESRCFACQHRLNCRCEQVLEAFRFAVDEAQKASQGKFDEGFDSARKIMFDSLNHSWFGRRYLSWYFPKGTPQTAEALA